MLMKAKIDCEVNVEPRISIITLGVSDMARSYNFYHDGLGFPTSGGPNDPIVFFKTSGACLAIFPFQGLADDIAPGLPSQRGCFGGITIAHNTRTKGEVDEILELAERSGGKIVKSAEIAGWGGYSGYFTDPDGYYWEVAWSPKEGQFNPDGSIVID